MYLSTLPADADSRSSPLASKQDQCASRPSADQGGVGFRPIRRPILDGARPHYPMTIIAFASLQHSPQRCRGEDKPWPSSAHSARDPASNHDGSRPSDEDPHCGTRLRLPRTERAEVVLHGRLTGSSRMRTDASLTRLRCLGVAILPGRPLERPVRIPPYGAPRRAATRTTGRHGRRAAPLDRSRSP